MGFLDLLVITAVTVSKVLLCSAVGLFVSKKFEAPEKSLKGLSAISLIIFLPCLLFGNLVLRVTWKALQDFYWAPVLSSLPMALGYSFSLLFRLFLNREWHAVLSLGCTFQNGLTFPLSLLLSLKGISWLTPEAVDRGQSYIFLYNITCSVGLWAIGEPMIKFHKRELVKQRREKRHCVIEGMTCHASSMEVNISQEGNAFEEPKGNVSSNEAKNKEDTEVHLRRTADSFSVPERASCVDHRALRRLSVTEQLRIYRPHDDKGVPICLSSFKNSFSVLDHALMNTVSVIKSPPIASTILALVVSLAPPLRWTAETLPATALIGGIKTIGAGAIPLQLLVLGGNIANSFSQQRSTESNDAPSLESANDVTKNDDSAQGENRKEEIDDEETNEDVEKNESLYNINILNVVSVSQLTVFCILTVFLRLFAIPFFCFCVYHGLFQTGVLPKGKVFRLAILLESCAPSAINSSLICCMYSYKVRPYTRMVLIMYINCIWTTTLWLAFFIWYLGEEE